MDDFIKQKLSHALQCCQQGKFADAITPLKQITSQYQIPFASFLYATALSQTGNNRGAIAAYQKAIQLQPVYPEAYNNMGVAYETLDQLSSAEQCYGNALEQKPDYASALYNLGHIKQTQHKMPEALHLYQRAVRANPAYAKAWNNLGLVQQEMGEFETAEYSFKQAMHLSNNDPEIINNMGLLFFNFGNHTRALEFYQQALAINPNIAQIHNNIALVYQQLTDYQHAILHLNQAILLRPDYVEANTNLGNIHKEQDDFVNAKTCYEKALEMSPEYPEALVNYGLLLYREEKYQQALSLFEKAYHSNPQFKEAEYNIATNSLSEGNFVKGWQHYRARPIPRHFMAWPLEKLRTTDLTNQRILLLSEQGIGDEIFFLRFAQQLKPVVAQLSAAVSDKLFPMLENTNFIHHVFSINHHPNDFDCYISLGDLPALLVEENNNIPASIRLTAAPDNLEKMQQMLAEAGPPPYTAITWRGGQKVKNLLYKQMPLSLFWQAVENLPGTLISLQRQPDEQDIQQMQRLNQQRKIVDFSHINEDLPNMLALLDLIDEYIGVSNTNMHLRAALGRNAKVIVQHPAEWRWMFSGDSPWFPGFQIYRQTADKDWSSAVSCLTKDLQIRYGQ